MIRGWLVSVAITIAITACAGWQVTPVAPAALESVNNQVAPPPTAPVVVIRPDVKVETPSPQPRFDIAVNGVPARQFFLSLMRGTQTNIVVHPEVSGEISLQLTQVTLDELLEVTRNIYGYDYKKHNRIYTIYSKNLRTATFPVNYINVKRVGVSDTSVLTGNIESATQNSSNTEAGQPADLIGDGKAIAPGARIQTHTETDFWVSLQQAISELIGVQRDNGDNLKKVIVNPQAGVVVVTAMPDELAAVGEFIQVAQTKIEKQVVIEAKIVEITLNKDYEAGINWDQINGQLLLGNNVSEFVSPNTIVTASESVGEVFSSLIKISDISRLLSLLETQGNVQVLSSPRVATVNNQKAVIRVGSDRFFVTGISNTTTTSSGSVTNNPDVELSSFFSGISLDVTPQISDENSIILHIHPVVSTVVEEQKSITVGDNAFSLPLALRDIRESDSIVRADNRQIIVLGGLMQEKSLTVDGKRPGLGDIPLVKSLFSKKRQQQFKSELVILLKPVVVEGDTWSTDINVSSNRINQWQQQDNE